MVVSLHYQKQTAMTTQEKTHKTIAQTLRYCGINATCEYNANETQPYEVTVKNVTESEFAQIINMVCDMFKSRPINLIKK
jgi:hypothetical protein